MHIIYYQPKSDLVEFEKFPPRIEHSRNLMQIKVDRFRTDVSRNSFKYRGSVLWNALPHELNQTKGNNAFKNKLKRTQETDKQFQIHKRKHYYI